jgi:hypothetical protein
MLFTARPPGPSPAGSPTRTSRRSPVSCAPIAAAIPCSSPPSTPGCW